MVFQKCLSSLKAFPCLNAPEFMSGQEGGVCHPCHWRCPQPINQCPPTGFHACPPTRASGRGGTSPQPHWLCLLCFFSNVIRIHPHNYTSYTTSTLKKCELRTPLQTCIPCALLDQKFSRDSWAPFFHSLQISLPFWSNVKLFFFFFPSTQPDINSDE